MKAPCLKCKEYKIKESGFIRTMEHLTAELTLAKEVMQHDREYIDELMKERDALKEGLDGWHARYLDMAAIAGEKHD